MNAIGRLLLGSGKLPEQLRQELAAEGIVMLEEGLRGTLTYRNYRAPGRRYGLKKSGLSGAIALTSRRLVVWAARSRQIDVSLGQPGIDVARDGSEKVVVAYEASDFSPDRSGRVEIRLRTPNAARIVELVSARLP